MWKRTTRSLLNAPALCEKQDARCCGACRLKPYYMPSTRLLCALCALFAHASAFGCCLLRRQRPGAILLAPLGNARACLLQRLLSSLLDISPLYTSLRARRGMPVVPSKAAGANTAVGRKRCRGERCCGCRRARRATNMARNALRRTRPAGAAKKEEELRRSATARQRERHQALWAPAPSLATPAFVRRKNGAAEGDRAGETFGARDLPRCLPRDAKLALYRLRAYWRGAALTRLVPPFDLAYIALSLACNMLQQRCLCWPSQLFFPLRQAQAGRRGQAGGAVAWARLPLPFYWRPTAGWHCSSLYLFIVSSAGRVRNW